MITRKQYPLPPLADGLLAVALFASVPVAVKHVSANAFTVGLVRLLIAVSCFLLLLAIRGRRLHKLSGRDWLALFVLGVCFGTHWVTYFLSIKTSSAAVGAISLSTYGLDLVLLAWLLQGIKPTLFDLAGLGLAIAGTLMIIPAFSLENEVTLGVILGVLSGVFYSLCPIIHQRNRHLPSSLRAPGQFLFALLVFLPFVPKMDFSLPVSDWQWLLYLGVVCTFVAHTLWVRSTTNLSTLTTSVISYLYVPGAMLLSNLFLDEAISSTMIIGALLIVCGNLATLGKLRRRPAPLRGRGLSNENRADLAKA